MLPISMNIKGKVNIGTYSGGLTYQINNGPASFLSFAQITEGTGQGSWQQWNAAFSLNPTDFVTITAPNGAIIDRMVLTVVPEPATMIAGALLLLPFALSTFRLLRRNRAA